MLGSKIAVRPMCSASFALPTDCCNQNPLKRVWWIPLGLQTETRTLPVPKSWSLASIFCLNMQMFLNCFYMDICMFEIVLDVLYMWMLCLLVWSKWTAQSTLVRISLLLNNVESKDVYLLEKIGWFHASPCNVTLNSASGHTVCKLFSVNLTCLNSNRQHTICEYRQSKNQSELALKMCKLPWSIFLLDNFLQSYLEWKVVVVVASVGLI